jgi:group I intron endonuclease
MIKNKDYCVYMHTSPKGKKYVGITCRNPLYRWQNGQGYKHNVHFNKAIIKYGWDNFKHEILESGLCKEEAEEKEIFLIKELNLQNPNCGYNLSSGGAVNRGFKYSAQSRKKLSDSLRGIVRSEKYKENMKIACANHKPTTEAILKSQEVCKRAVRAYSINGEKLQDFDSMVDAAEKLNGVNDSSMITKCCKSEVKQAYGYIFRYLECAPEKIDAVKTHKKPIVQYTLNGEEIKWFQSAKEASYSIQKDSTCIIACCKGKRKTAYGFVWGYAL